MREGHPDAAGGAAVLTGQALLAAVQACDSPAEQAFLVALAPLLPEGAEVFPQAQLHPRVRVDFLCKLGERQVVVEIDGAAYHFSAAQRELDRARDARLKLEGYTVVRFPARQVLRSTGAAAAARAVVRELQRKMRRRSA